MPLLPVMPPQPVIEVLHDFFEMITPVAWAGLAVLVVLVAVRRAPDRREVRAAAGLMAIGVVWSPRSPT